MDRLDALQAKSARAQELREKIARLMEALDGQARTSPQAILSDWRDVNLAAAMRVKRLV
jgi:hypothetical protein